MYIAQTREEAMRFAAIAAIMFFMYGSSAKPGETARDQVIQSIGKGNYLPATILLKNGNRLFLEYGASGEGFCYTGGDLILVTGTVDKKTGKIKIDVTAELSRCPSMD